MGALDALDNALKQLEEMSEERFKEIEKEKGLDKKDYKSIPCDDSFVPMTAIEIEEAEWED